VLKLLGIVALVALILLGALLPLKYTSRMQLPKASPQHKRGGPTRAPGADDGSPDG
jgi:hypothetical protein